MEKTENNDSYNYIFSSKGQKSSNFESSTFHSNASILYQEIDLISLIEDSVDNRNENDSEELIEGYNSFLEEQNNTIEIKED